MRILQIIDSLEAGGAERMAVNYANALVSNIEFSGLVATRKEGPLLNQMDKKVGYLFLNKKSAIDIKALLKLRQFVRQNRVEAVQSHSTSVFLAAMLKLTLPSIKLIWHDHYGDSEFLDKRPTLGLRIMLSFFKGIIVVNQKLKIWAKQQLHFENVIYLPNFPSNEKEVSKQTVLKGIQGKRILSLANLRLQKNHFLLLEVVKKVKMSHPEWSFHLVGKDFEDDYSSQIRVLIKSKNLENNVFIYGSKNDIKNILNQSEIAILTSKSEGLPIALIEYGLSKKPVVSTKVGEIPLIIKDGINGFIVGVNEVDLFHQNLLKFIDDEGLRVQVGNSLYQTIINNNSEEGIITNYLNWVLSL